MFRVNPGVHLCLIAVLVVLLSWPDTTFPHLLRVGFQAVGWIPLCGIWDTKSEPFLPFYEVFEGSESDANSLLRSLRSSADDAVAHEAGLADEQAGFCAKPFFSRELLGHKRAYRLIRRFVITQSSGKKRVIDNACAGGQSRLSLNSNQLRFCSAVQPCLRLQALHRHTGGSPLHWPDSVSTAGDLPQAYRKIPMDPDHSWACIVTTFDPVSSQPVFRRYHGMLFGLPLAVSAFNRLPFFFQSVLHRLLATLCAFYFDDLTCQDWTSTCQFTQEAVRSVCSLLGYPFATEKQQAPGLQNDFLGLVHDFRAVRSEGLIHLWLRPRLLDKIQDLIDQARISSQLLPGQASKLFGCMTCLDQGTIGHVSRAGLNAIKDRQYSADKDLSAELQRAFTLVEALFELAPRRIVELQPSLSGHLLVASDASQDQPLQGKAGALLQTPGLALSFRLHRTFSGCGLRIPRK